MLDIRSVNSKINRLHEIVLRIVCSDLKSFFENRLEKDRTFSVHTKYLQRKCLRYRKTFLYL